MPSGGKSLAQSARKDQPLNMDDNQLCAKNEKELETQIQTVKYIQSRYRDAIWHRKMRHASNEKLL